MIEKLQTNDFITITVQSGRWDTEQEIDLQRENFSILKDKINEIIDHINNKEASH